MGWFDLNDGGRQLENPAFAAAFDQAIEDHLRPNTATTQSTIVGDVVNALGLARPSGPSAPAVADLALHRPGHSVFARAAELRAVSPWKTLFARLFGIHTDERAYRMGGRGEQKVARQLRRLGPDWKVLHSIPVGDADSDIDHVVIGPGGVYTLNAKFHPEASVWSAGDAFMVNGQWVPYVRNSRHEAQRAGRILTAATGIPVQPTGVVVVVGARRGFRVKSQPEDGNVFVVARTQLARWLKRQTREFTPMQIDRIFDSARRPETWRHRPT